MDNLTDQHFSNDRLLKESFQRNIASLQRLASLIKNMTFSTQMSQNLMMDLLDFAQIEKNTFKLNKEPFNMFEVI